LALLLLFIAIMIIVRRQMKIEIAQRSKTVMHMKACTRCGTWHTFPEDLNGRPMSCTEVKLYWSDMKRRHLEQTGHLAMIRITRDGRIVCLKCGQVITAES
jgi:hypothetical protein